MDDFISEAAYAMAIVELQKLAKYAKELITEPSYVAVIFNLQKPVEYNLLSLPLYAVDELFRLIAELRDIHMIGQCLAGLYKPHAVIFNFLKNIEKESDTFFQFMCLNMIP